MKRKPQIFTTINAQDVPVNPTVLVALEQEELVESLVREYARKLLSEQDVLAQGMCFPFAYQKAEKWFEQHYTPPSDPDSYGKKHPDLNDKSKFKVVHGTVTDKWKTPVKPVVHGWVEMGDLVFDDQTQHTKPGGVNKEFYYEMFQPEVYKEFTAEEAVNNCIMKGGEGPWDDALYAMMQDRDAWMNEAAEPADVPVRQSFDIPIPKDLQDIHSRMKYAGRELYLVGGAVRDALMGQSPKDYDVATNASPEEVIKILQKDSKLKLDLTGKSFGVVRVKTPDGSEYEIATFREDIGKGKNTSVKFSTIENDVRRRDLTINALFYEMDSGEVVDYVGGIKDIEDGIIRAVGEPGQRFDEDRIRILRAARFAGRMGSNLDAATKQAILEDNALIDTETGAPIPGDRITEEFIKGIKSAQDVSHFLSLIQELELFDQILPGLDVELSEFGSQDHIAQIAAILKNNPSDLVVPSLQRMRYSNNEIKTISFLIRIINLNQETAAKLKKDFNRLNLNPDHLENFAEITGTPSEAKVRGFLGFAAAPLAGDPKELMAQGLKGPEIGQAMANAEAEAYLEFIGEVRKYVRQILRSS